MGEGERTDAEIIAASTVDYDAFADLYDRHAAQLHRFAARRLGATAADDVTAETFLVAFRMRTRFDQTRDSARPWLYGIATRLIGRQRRGEVRALRAMARMGHDPVSQSWASQAWVEQADERVLADAMSRQLATAIAALAPRDRHVLLLVAWADFSYVEVAEALQIPVGTVRSRLNRARRQVRSTLGAPDPIDLDAVNEPKEA